MRHFCSLERLLFFYLKHHQTLYQGFLKKKQIQKNFQVFDQNHGLTPKNANILTNL